MARRSGGGITSKNLVHKPVRVGKGATRVNERGVSQIGQSLGDHITERRGTVNPVERVRAGAMGGMGNVPLGNAKAKELSGANAGCGKGRTVYASGSQSAPTTRAIPEGRNTLAEFGPDVPGRK